MEIRFQGRRPVRQHEDDAGADLTAAETVKIPAGGIASVGTGTRVQLPTGTVGVVASRSGLAFTHGVGLVNGIGVIDAGFTGEIRVALVNNSRTPFTVRAGDRVAQLVVMPVWLPTFIEGGFDQTVRGDAGFGSTGAA